MMDIATPEVAHHFMATFFFHRLPSPLDIRFGRISGLDQQLQSISLREGGRNVGGITLPERVTSPALVLERGVITVTPVSLWFARMMGDLAVNYADVVIMLLNHAGVPICSWTASQALPTRWTTADLDASSNLILINSLELSYHELLWMGAKR